jgi:predicted ATPase
MKTRRRVAAARRAVGAPFLRRVASVPETIDQNQFPFSIPVFSRGIDLAFLSKVTFFVGENGSGKSTLLEALAECGGFNPEGGNRDHHREVFADRSPLAQALRLSWQPKVTEGFFMRAESFYNFATYIEAVSDLRAYGGKSLHEQSHRRDTRHFVITREFLNSPERFFKHLFGTVEDKGTDACSDHTGEEV